MLSRFLHESALRAVVLPQMHYLEEDASIDQPQMTACHSPSVTDGPRPASVILSMYIRDNNIM
ncbi:hypothetical protein [Paenibacillus phytorum]|uniref:hypothetical protein n=1 Tax=Paenibacillus phytorum TaxID=2654977 RepID=UPI001493084F|nr:hypothetical protein [Paenibacillus phytorum]